MEKTGRVILYSTKVEPIELALAIAPAMKSHRFKKSKRTWTLHGTENILLFNIEKSPWGGSGIFINGGVFIPSIIISDTAPVLHKCHLYGRVHHMLPEGRPALAVTRKAEENALISTAEMQEFATGLIHFFLPSFLTMETLRGVQKLLPNLIDKWLVRTEMEALM